MASPSSVSFQEWSFGFLTSLWQQPEAGSNSSKTNPAQKFKTSWAPTFSVLCSLKTNKIWLRKTPRVYQDTAKHRQEDAFRLAGAVQETCSSEKLGGQGADLLRRVAFWSISSSGLLRWFCVRGATLRMTWPLASLFRGRRSTLHRWSGKIAKGIGTRPSALHSAFYFWRKSRRIASIS